MSYVFDGIMVGLLFGVIAYVVFAFICTGINALYNKIKDGEFIISDKSLLVPIIPAVIISVMCIICGIQMRLEDKWVDFYNNEGQIVETYQITDYDKSWFGNGTTFYLTDGRMIVKKDCIYNIRFEGEKK